jgi:hypothetical protein
LFVNKIVLYFSKQGGARWGQANKLPVDRSKYKHEVLKGDSSSTSHLVESAESSTSQAPPVPNRPSPMTSTHSSYRQAPVNAVLAYHQASSLAGFRAPPPPIRSYSPDQDDEIDTNVHVTPVTTNRSRTITPFGSHKSLSESIHSLRSNQQPALSLPVKKRSQEPPPPPAPIVPKRDQRTPSPKSFEAKKDYQHHHYHNPGQLRAHQQQKQRLAHNNSSSEEDEFEQQQLNNTKEDSAVRIFTR